MSRLLLCLTLLALFSLACEGPAGPTGPQGPEGPKGEQGRQGPQGPTADIAELQARVDSLEAVINFALGGTPETTGPLTLGDTQLTIVDPVGTRSVNFVTDTEFIGEIKNTGKADAVDVKIAFRLRVDGVAVSDKTIAVGTVRIGENKIFSFVVDGTTDDYSSLDFSITYRGGGPFTGSVRIRRL